MLSMTYIFLYLKPSPYFYHKNYRFQQLKMILVLLLYLAFIVFIILIQNEYCG